MRSILRLRLELDRTLRSRSFFSRAVQGGLEAREYRDLLVQYGALLANVEPGVACSAARVRADLRALAPDDPGDPEDERPAALEVVLAGARAWGRSLPPGLARDVTCAVVATSWTVEALEALSRAFPGSTTFLEALVRGGPGALDGVRRGVGELGALAQRVRAFAELTRGAVLGLATDLDTTWPARTIVAGLALAEGAEPASFVVPSLLVPAEDPMPRSLVASSIHDLVREGVELS